MTTSTQLILNELKQVISLLNVTEMERAASLIVQSKRVFIAGAGRSGLMGRAFAMRLAHLGITAYVVGETTTPSIDKHDLLVICSGSGETRSLAAMGEKAKLLGASLLVLTTNPNSTCGVLADGVIHIQAKAKEEQGNNESLQPMGSLFEQSLLISLDGLILTLMNQMDISAEQMLKRHANLE